MNIIERITKNDKDIFDDKSNIQKISLDRLKANPIPNSKNEIWRQTNKSKFSRFLDFKFSNDFYYPQIPGHSNIQNTCRIIIGENKKIYLTEKNWKIKDLEEKEILNFLKQKIIQSDTTQNWSCLLYTSPSPRD